MWRTSRSTGFCTLKKVIQVPLMCWTFSIEYFWSKKEILWILKFEMRLMIWPTWITALCSSQPIRPLVKYHVAQIQKTLACSAIDLVLLSTPLVSPCHVIYECGRKAASLRLAGRAHLSDRASGGDAVGCHCRVTFLLSFLFRRQ